MSLARSVLLALIAGVVLVVLSRLLSSYALVLATRMLVFAIFGMSLDLLVGYLGLSSLGHAAFFGAAGYVTGLMTLRVESNAAIVVSVALLTALLLGLLFGALALRARLIYFMMLTLALAQVVWGIAFQWRDVTHGDDGLANIPRPWVGPWQLVDNAGFFLFSGALFIISALILLRIAASPYGLSLKGIRESPTRMAALGYNVWLHQYIAFQIAAVFAGLAGALVAYQNGIVSPSQISIVTSAEALLMVILGGAGTIVGPILGAVVVVLLEYLISAYTQRWISVLGIIYILVVVGAPAGLYPPLRSLLVRGFARLTGRRAQPAAAEPAPGIAARADQA